jgi:hypothetical protein
VAVILGVRAPGCVAVIQRLPARVRGVAQGQEGNFPLGRRARECVRAPTSVPAQQARPIRRAGVAQRRKPCGRKKRGRE